MGTKNNPGTIDCYAAAAPDEPIFILRATDSSAPLAVRIWCELYRDRKMAAGEWDDKAKFKYLEAMDCADEMRLYHYNEVIRPKLTEATERVSTPPQRMTRPPIETALGDFACIRGKGVKS